MQKIWRLTRLSGAIVGVGLLAATAACAVTLVFEAEHYTWIKPCMEKVTDTGAAGGHCVQIPLRRPHGVEEMDPSDDGNVTFKIYVPQAGRYRLFARVHWYDSCGNSFFVFVDDLNTQNALYLTDSSYQKWHWVGMRDALGDRQYTLTKGYHLIRFQNREDGAKLDQLLLTTKPERGTPVRIQRETPQYLWRPEQ